jgi:GTP-binding protein Era
MHALNRAMNRTVTGALSEVDLVLWVLEAGKILPQDRTVLEVLPDDRPVIAVVNKLDRITPREKLLPWLAELGQLRKFAEIVPMSAQKKADAPRLLSIMEPYLHEGEWGYEEDALTDRSERFLAAEILREKLFRLTGDELPYTSTVVIEQFAQEGDLRRISAAIIVDRDGHKAMVIGAGGERLKRISTEARQDMQVLFDGPVFLEVWVKTRSGWADDQAAVRAFGYED